LGFHPKPRKLLKKFDQNFNKNRAIARFLLVFGQAFFKKLVGCGAKPHGFLS